MRNVAKRMLYGEVAQALIRWQMKWREHANAERGKAIMRRVGGRWRNREASDAVREWHAKQVEAKQRGRGEAIMRRVGGRWLHKELAMNFSEWVRNYKSHLSGSRARLEDELATLKVKFAMVTQVSMGHAICVCVCGDPQG